MVNFEFAPVADIRPSTLTDYRGAEIEQALEMPESSDERPEMANILGNREAFEGANADLRDPVPSENVEFAADIHAAEQMPEGPSVFGNFAGAEMGSAMEALLMLQAPAKAEAEVSGDADKAAGEAVAEIAAEAQVDALFDHFADGDVVSIQAEPAQGLLDSMIGQQTVHHMMNAMPQDQTDEAAALAAASA